MRFRALSSLLCILLLCFSIFSVEGKKHPRRMLKSSKSKPCCSLVAGPALRTQKGRVMKSCKPCKLKAKYRPWVVPGALPQV